MRKTLFIFLSTFLLSCNDVVNLNENSHQKENQESRSDMATECYSFEFPSIQWNMLDTHKQKVAACEIPDSILPTISTEELVDICMKYPLILDVYAFDSPLEGIKHIVSQFNGFVELMKRKDNCICMLKYLQENQMKEISVHSFTEIEIGRFLLIYSLGEYLLSLEDVMKNATSDIKKEIATLAQKNLDTKENGNDYALNDLASSTFLWASALSIDKKLSRTSNEVLETFLKNGIILNYKDFLEIKMMCSTYKN